MKIAVLRENAPGETRVALIPADVPRLVKRGAEVHVETDAGRAAGYPDDEYVAKGATVAPRSTVLQGAELILAIRAGAASPAGATEAAELPEGATIVALLDPYAPSPAFETLASRGITAFSLERVPRITRAQSMDVLSSQANLAGYRAVLLAAEAMPRVFPMLMTAAGTIVPVKVFIVGVGVAGLQAIATAKRLGAVVSAYDVRPAVKEQVESLGARFVEMDLDTGASETSGGYAREMDEEFYRKQREMMTEVVADSDVVITTAAIPGRQAPVLVTAEMVRGMRPGSVIVDLAAERGGNCELSRAGETVVDSDVRILGPVNVPAGLAYHASQLFSRNVVTFASEILNEGALTINRDDEIIAATLVLDAGKPGSDAYAATLGFATANQEG